jgi:hypothetical protein
MLNRLLYISSLLCLLIVQGVEARQLKVVAETSTFTDYEFSNPNLEIMSPIGFTVPVSGDTPSFQVLEQTVEIITTSLSAERIHVMALSGAESPLLDIAKPGVYRGKKVSPVSLNIARIGESSAQVVKNIKIRVYKEGDLVQTSAQKRNTTTPDFENGQWYKIPIEANSIYEIDSEYLEELGINLGSINPENIQIWGASGYLLPEINSQDRPELTQIPILVEGGDDGNFGASDRIIFYANSPNEVRISDSGNYEHILHPYSYVNYVFLTIANDPGLRLETVNNNFSPSRTITTFKDFIWKEEELYKVENRIKSGRNWLGQQFQTSSDGAEIKILNETLPGLIPGSNIEISGRVVNRSTNSASFTINGENSTIATINIPQSGSYTASDGFAGLARNYTGTVTASSSDVLSISAIYNHSASGSMGFIDWITITAERELQAEDNYLYFFSPVDGSDTELAQYQLSGFDSAPTVLDVTDPVAPKLLTISASGNQYRLNYYSGSDLQFIAQSEYRTPDTGEIIPAQNLHDITDYPDYVIITNSLFKNYADELASYRANSDGLTPVVVLQDHIFNRFSGGVPDPSALRDYTKFLYDRALADGEEPPRYLLFFGDATFDYKDITEAEFTNHIFTYQSEESLNRAGSYSTDDFFGFLDDGEGNMDAQGSGGTLNSELLDIGLGRISAQTTAEAAIAVQKIKNYENPSNTGDWQNLLTFAADDDFPNVQLNRDLHVLNADETAERMNLIEPGLRINKIYEFEYPEEIGTSGRTVPGATDAFIRSLNDGTLVLNYSGHGNEQTLSDEELFTTDLIPSLTNRDKLSVLVTATCQFGRYDDNDAQSGAEQLFFAENGGVVAAFTTTRVVYTGSGISSRNNFGLNVALSQRMVERNMDGSALRMGDIYTRSKNTSINGSVVISTRNSKKFILIGDPAAKFRLPELATGLSTLNENSGSDLDTTLTIRALDQVQLSGQIRDLSGNPISDYNGEALITVLDSKRTVGLPTDRDWVVNENCYMRNRPGIEDCSYKVENDVLFKGRAAVENGQFSSSFIVPKDISFSGENGRIVFFANNNGLTAGGSFTNIKFNGINEDAQDDGAGPSLDIFLNDQRFVNGNLVNSSPNLIIELEDQSGINTTGTGVGHEIIATIDTNPQQSFILNDYYEGSIGDFTRGRIEYPLDQLPDGSYTLKVRAWDVHNNPSEKEIFFEVASGNDLTVRNVYNFPNPMNNATRFSFEHNQPGNPMDVSLRIYTLSGRPVQHIEQQLITTSSYASISWDGRDQDYDRLGNGTYIYVLRVTTDTPEGKQTAEQIEKLVIIR